MHNDLPEKPNKPTALIERMRRDKSLIIVAYVASLAFVLHGRWPHDIGDCIAALLIAALFAGVLWFAYDAFVFPFLKPKACQPPETLAEGSKWSGPEPVQPINRTPLPPPDNRKLLP